MKKTVSVILSALMLLSVLVSCAPAQDKLDPAITLASSDALAKAEWLSERLGTIPDDVILGVGSSAGYGIDMSDFEDDGYIVRSIGGEVLLFGKTEAGLDRAVREYAKAADIDATATLNTVYHEGVRVEKMTIAGRDISEFTVVYNHDRDIVNPTTNYHGYVGKTIGNAGYAAEELVRLVAKATGVTLPIKTEDVKTPMIKIDYVEDGACGENGFNYKVENGNVYINGASEANGCANGVYHFLEYQCGWDGLMYGDSDLQEAELVDVPNGASANIDPIFDYVRLHYLYRFPFTNDRSSFSQNYSGVIAGAMHGMQHHEWSGLSNNSVFYNQICHTNESNYQNTFDSVWTYVDNEVRGGAVIGETLTTIDISQGDNLNYCKCSSCMKVYKEENNAHSGAVLRFANRLAEDMEAEDYGGLAYQIFAYHGSNKPCKTEARDDVYVTLCNDGSCQNHPLDGSECTGVSFDMAGAVPGMEHLNNKDYAEWMIGWGKICKNVYLWHYALDNNFGQYTYFDVLYDDIMFMKESNLKGLFLEQENYGLGLGRLRMQLFNLLIYNPDVTEAEYEVMRNEIMKREYGDGWDFVLDYIGIWRETEKNSGCWNCWGYGDLLNLGHYDTELYSKRADEMYRLLERAKALTSTKDQEMRIERLMLEVAYRQCATTYFAAAAGEQVHTLAKLEQRYADFVKYSINNGYSLAAYDGGLGLGTHKDLADNLYDAAANEWAEYAEELTPETPQYQYKHVVIIGVDGAGAAWQDTATPSMDEIFANGATTNMCRVSNPTISAHNWASFMTGAVPQIHGLDNDIAGEERYELFQYPTFFKMVRQAHPGATLASFVTWDNINYGIIEDDIGVHKVTGENDADVKDKVVEYLETERPELLFVDFDLVDMAGHDHGGTSKNYYNAINMADDYIGQIYDALVANGMIEDTLFIVTADHGHTPSGGHGGQTDVEKYVFFGAVGKTVLPNDDIEMYLLDAPAIVTHALVIAGNEASWDSYLPAGIFSDAPEGQIRDYASTVGHETVETPTDDKALSNYVDMDKLDTAIFFDEDLSDINGNATATANGDVTYVDGYYGSAAKISETSNISVDGIEFGTDSFAIGLWVKTNVSYFESPVLYANKAYADLNANGFLFAYHSDSDFNVGIGSEGTTVKAGLPEDYDKANWHHTLLVVNREEETLGIYYNFKLLREYDLDDHLEGVSLDTDSPFIIGDDTSGECGMAAQLDDLLIFNGALSRREIDSLRDYYFQTTEAE